MKKKSTSLSLRVASMEPRAETISMLKLFARVYSPLKAGLENGGFKCNSLAGKTLQLG